MSKNKVFHYRVDFENEKIEISNAFATAAQKAKTAAHKQLMDIRKAYPGFGLAIYHTEITSGKQTYKGLGFDEMRRCIIEWDGEASPNIAILDKAKKEKIPYPKVKKWYLDIYDEHYKRAADVAVPAAVENTDTAAGNC